LAATSDSARGANRPFVRAPSGINADDEGQGGGGGRKGSGRVLKKSNSMMNPPMHRQASAQNILKAKKGRPGGGSVNSHARRGSWKDVDFGATGASNPQGSFFDVPHEETAAAAPPAPANEDVKQRQRRLSGAGIGILRGSIPEFRDSSEVGEMPEL